MQLRDKQASDKDYTNIKQYNRGPLFPCFHANQNEDIESTYTLTNNVPQAAFFNSGSWKTMENHVKKVMDELCCDKEGKHLAFVVTGVFFNASLPLNKVHNVYIPYILWTAFCCKIDGGKWLAEAHWGDNIAEAPNMEGKTLAELKTALKVEPFTNKECIEHSKVSEYYAEHKNGDTCPLPPPNPNSCDPPQPKPGR